MASEMRRAAKALIQTRVETLEVPDAVEAARERVERALAGLGASPTLLRYQGAWNAVDGRATYVATFTPSPRTPWLLNGASVAFVLLIAASAWAVLAAEGASARFLLPMLTVLGIIAFPFVIAGFAAQREAEESRILRAIRAALSDAG